MSKLERWWVVAVVAVAIVAGVAVALGLKDEKNSIAAYAAIVGTVSILLAAEKHLRDKRKEDKESQQKEDEKKEVLTATVVIKHVDKPPRAVCVELYNAGKVMVPIKQVRLVVSKDAFDIDEYIMDYPVDRPAIRVSPIAYSPQAYSQRVDLQPKQHIIYSDSNLSGSSIDSIMKSVPDDVRIVVESFTGEVLQISGSVIQDAIELARVNIKPKK